MLVTVSWANATATRDHIMGWELHVERDFDKFYVPAVPVQEVEGSL